MEKIINFKKQRREEDKQKKKEQKEIEKLYTKIHVQDYFLPKESEEQVRAYIAEKLGLARKYTTFGRKYADASYFRGAEWQYRDVAKIQEKIENFRNAAKNYTTAEQLATEGINYELEHHEGYKTATKEKCKDYHRNAKECRHKAALEKIIEDKKLGPVRSWLVRNTRGYTPVLLFLISFLFIAPNFTGFSISSSVQDIGNYLGILFFIFGIVFLGIFLFVRKQIK